MKILVTGGNGFIDRHCVDRLAARDGAEFVTADLLVPGASMAVIKACRPDALLHFAWETRRRYFWNALEPRLGWKLVWRCFALFGRGRRRVVIAATCGEYDWPDIPEDGVCSEYETPLSLHTLYGAKEETGVVVTRSRGFRATRSQSCMGASIFMG